MTRTTLLLAASTALAIGACAEPAPAEAVLECPADQWLALADYEGDAIPAFADDYAGFLVENGTRGDVVTTESGLQYRTIQDGVDGGVSPERTDPVTVHYHGYFPNGEVFDSSYERGETIAFQPGQVIAGWTEALMDMEVCEARILYIPSDLAYGQGRPGIPAGATLLFNVQMLGVDAPQAVVTE